MSKSKNRQRSTRRVVSKVPAPVRLGLIAGMIRDTVDAHLDEYEGLHHLHFLAIHACGPRLGQWRSALVIGGESWDEDSARDVLRGTLERYESWGDGVGLYENTQLVNSAVEMLTRALSPLAGRDPVFGQTAIMGAYPGGAACIGYALGAQRLVLRRMLFAEMGVEFPGTNASAAVAQIGAVQ